jgi:hypothetical protein
MKRISIIIGLTFLVFAALVVLAAQTPPPQYMPSEVQALRLQVKQKDAIIAQRDSQEAMSRAQAAFAALLAEGEKIKADNKWPAEVKFDPQGLVFIAPPPPPATPTPEKPKGGKP